MQVQPLTTRDIRQKLNLYDFPFREMPDEFVEYVFPTQGTSSSNNARTDKLESLGKSVLKAIAALYTFRKERGEYFDKRTKQFTENSADFLTTKGLSHSDVARTARTAHALFGSLYSYLEGSRGYKNSLELIYGWFNETWELPGPNGAIQSRPGVTALIPPNPETYEDHDWTSYGGVKLKESVRTQSKPGLWTSPFTFR